MRIPFSPHQVFWLVVLAALGGVFIGWLTPESPPSHSPPRAVKVAEKSHVWTKMDSLAYAHDQVVTNAENQFSCLVKLWSKESAWDHKAVNPVKEMGKNAGGIPQLLGMSPSTPPTIQIDRGLSYIYYRYVTPCRAWKHWLKFQWY